MSQNVESAPDGSAQAAVNAIGRQLVAGKKPNDVVADLTGAGWPQDKATDFVHQVNVALRAARRGAGRRLMLIGAAWCVGGLAVSYFTYMAASHGGTYFLAWGAVLFGAYDMIRGFIMWVTNREPLPPSLLAR